jgi:hypothetical protein
MTEINNVDKTRYDVLLEKINTLEQLTKVRFCAAQKALELSSGELNRRLEGMNEIRSQLDRQAATFVTREKSEAIYERIATVETLLAASEARTKVYVVVLSGFTSFVSAVAVGLIVYFVAK